MAYKEELEQIQEEIETKTAEKIRLEEKKKQLESQKSEIIEDLASEGLTADKLNAEIKALEEEIKTEISKCQEVLA